MRIGHPDRNERNDLPVGKHRHDGPDRRAEGAGVGLGADSAGQRDVPVAQVLLADLGGVGMGVTGAVRRHHHHEIGIGADPDVLGELLHGRRRARDLPARAGRSR